MHPNVGKVHVTLGSLICITFSLVTPSWFHFGYWKRGASGPVTCELSRLSVFSLASPLGHIVRRRWRIPRGKERYERAALNMKLCILDLWWRRDTDFQTVSTLSLVSLLLHTHSLPSEFCTPLYTLFYDISHLPFVVLTPCILPSVTVQPGDRG